ncbi:NAD(P)(+) transhydrogenase (Re/Si-specific) subunit beta [Algoriphagus boritolerans]|uniref:NAD(P)(+) transhydrogenase (Re/Si-specific) subunit beta n=1 Tax=Algoriphagus boritolerans TaxID=308111 RepID=UPI002FCE0152
MTIAVQLAYLLASILFIIGIKLLGKTKDARRGNMLSAVGMLVAIAATLITLNILSFIEIFGCMLVGGAIGLYYAKKSRNDPNPGNGCSFQWFRWISFFERCAFRSFPEDRSFIS